MIIPLDFLKQFLGGDVNYDLLAKELTRLGLESALTKKEEESCLDFTPLPNRVDLLNFQGILKEISVLLNWKEVKTPFERKKLTFSFPLREDNRISWESAGLGEKVVGISAWLINSVVFTNSQREVEVFLRVNQKELQNSFSDGATMVEMLSGNELVLLDYDRIIREEGGKINLKEINQKLRINEETKNVLVVVLLKINSFVSSEATFKLLVKLLAEKDELIKSRVEKVLDFKEIKKVKPLNISLDFVFLEKKIGQRLRKQTVEAVWGQLGLPFSLVKNKNNNFVYNFQVPHQRSDITLKEDLVGEFLKIYGHNGVQNSEQIFRSEVKSTTALRVNDISKVIQKTGEIKNKLRQMGWQEVITFSLVSKEASERNKSSVKEQLRLLNPKTNEEEYLRTDLLASHLSVVQKNLNLENKNLFFFEVSNVYTEDSAETFLCLTATGKVFNYPFYKLQEEVDSLWLEGVLESILEHQGEVTFSFNEEGREKNIFFDGKEIGFIKSVKLENQTQEEVWFARLSLSSVLNPEEKKVKEGHFSLPSNFPVSKKDISFLISKDFNFTTVLKSIGKMDEDKIREVLVLDTFQTEEWNQKNLISVTVRLIIQSNESTVSSEESEKIVESIRELLQNEWKAEVR